MIQESQKKAYVDSISQKGFVEIQGAFSPEFLKKVGALIEKPLNKPTINGQKGYVKKNNTRFLFQTLSWGGEIIELYTQPDVLNVIERYVGGEVHLSNYRIYRTFPSRIEKMHWHVDNKIDVYDEATNQIVHKLMQDKGIIMIMYLSDVEDGGFQIVEGSHAWSVKENKESWNDRENDFKDKVVTFNNRPAGTLIIYDYRCIHRAKPYQGGKIRTSLFAQFTPAHLPVGEPILLNVRDIDQLTGLQKRVLNFGKKPSTENWPIGNSGELIEDLGLEAINSLVISQAKKVLKAVGIGKK